jgi:hypothetical protein
MAGSYRMGDQQVVHHRGNYLVRRLRLSPEKPHRDTAILAIE